ncbi:MAG: serine hydrolase, partial [Pseudomonadota bacterium]
MKKLGTGLGMVAVIAALVWWFIGADWRRLIIAAPTNADVLFWTQSQRDAGFRMLDRVSILVDSR